MAELGPIIINVDFSAVSKELIAELMVELVRKNTRGIRDVIMEFADNQRNDDPDPAARRGY